MFSNGLLRIFHKVVSYVFLKDCLGGEGGNGLLPKRLLDFQTFALHCTYKAARGIGERFLTPQPQA